MGEAKKYELECDLDSVDGVRSTVTKPLEWKAKGPNGFDSDEEAISFAESFAVGTLLYPDMSREDLGAHRVGYRVLLNGAVIAIGQNDRFNYGSEFPNS